MATQLEIVRRHLRDHGTITSVEASEVYKIRRLASRVHELRAEGLKVRSVRRKGRDRTTLHPLQTGGLTMLQSVRIVLTPARLRALAHMLDAHDAYDLHDAGLSAADVAEIDGLSAEVFGILDKAEPEWEYDV